jgi:hypothetical protein
VRDELKWYDHNADKPAMDQSSGRGPALSPARALVLPSIQAIIVAIDQYAEAALGKREFFLNKPYGIGGRARDNIP